MRVTLTTLSGSLRQYSFRRFTTILFSFLGIFIFCSAGVAEGLSPVTGKRSPAGIGLATVAPIFILKDPTNVTVLARKNASFSVTAIGTGVLQYQWFRAGIAMSQRTNATLTLTNVHLADATTYFVVVYNDIGSARSQVATLTVDGAVPPEITKQPASQTVLAGNDVTFTVEANGQEPLAYQWSKNGTAISNAVTSSLVLESVAATNAGSYTVVVTNQLGKVTSAAAVLVVNSPPAIRSGPASQTVAPGGSVTLSVDASGSDPLKYQWLKEGNPISGASSKELKLSQVKLSDSGGYSVVITNAFGAVTSVVATVTVRFPIMIKTQPASQRVLIGADVIFSVEVDGAGPFNYQWFRNGNGVVGGGEQVLSLHHVSASDAGLYKVAVNGPDETVFSANAELIVDSPAAILIQPVSQSVLEGTNITFRVAAAGTEPILYQWYKDGVFIPNAIGDTLVLTNVTVTSSGQYKVTVDNRYSSLESDPVFLSVSQSIAITRQPQNQRVFAGNNALFTVEAESVSPLSYQWFKDNRSIPGANNSILTLSSVTSSNAGTYQVFLKNALGSVTSTGAVLVVDVPITILTQPAGQDVIAGTDVLLSVSAQGVKPLQYQWLKNQSAIAGATNESLLLAAVELQDAGNYSVAISDGQATVTSAEATVEVVAPVTIDVQPVSQTIAAGSRVRLFIHATGTGPLNYQWLKEGQAIPGAVAEELILESATGNDSGIYTVRVNNFLGIAISSEARLTVTLPKTFHGDFNQDGQPDILFQNSQGALMAWLMNGTNLQKMEVPSPAQIGEADWQVVATGDFNGDSKEDLVFQHRSGIVGFWFLDGLKQNSASALGDGDPKWRVVAAADLNRDGNPDLLFQHEDGTLAVWYMRGTERIAAGLLTPSNPGDRRWRVVGVDDFNGDSMPDLVFQHQDGTLAIWYLKGTDASSTALFNPASAGVVEWRVVGVSDRNGDGHPDILFQHTDGTLGIWYMDGVTLKSAVLLNPSQVGAGWRVAAP